MRNLTESFKAWEATLTGLCEHEGLTHGGSQYDCPACCFEAGRAEGATEEREKQARPEGRHTAPPDPHCEDCRGTGWVGDNGPGQRGNREYVPCDCTADSRARAQKEKS